jgi:hypothetical protein
MPTIIGLLGPAGSGKSSVAGHLAERYGAKRYSFAAPLKELAMRTLDLTHEQCWGTQSQKEAVDPRYGFSPRWFLQRLGTEGCRKTFGEAFWTEQTLAKIAREAPSLAVIEDVRFKNEASAILNFRNSSGRGHVWRLEASERQTIELHSTHASEQEWAIAPFSTRLCPAAFGLEHLFALVDEAMSNLDLGKPVAWVYP